jgi:hypothetical protein
MSRPPGGAGRAGGRETLRARSHCADGDPGSVARCPNGRRTTTRATVLRRFGRPGLDSAEEALARTRPPLVRSPGARACLNGSGPPLPPRPA